MPLLPSSANPVTKIRLLRQNIQTDTNITNFQTDSKTNAIISPVAQEIANAYNEAREAFSANSVSSATGADLDALALKMGTSRRVATFASASESSRIVAFYAASGTFGGINGGADINLTGTIISTGAVNGADGTVIGYKVTNKVLAAADSLAYVEVVAQYAGAASNVGKGSLTSHNFTGYVNSSANSLKVVNFQPILSGSNQETDNLLRFRLSRLNASRQQIGDDRIFLRALRAPGVVDVRTVHAYYGIGTVGVFVLGAESQTTASMVASVQSQLNQIKAPGMELTATAATQVTFDFDLDVYFTRPVNQNIKDRVSFQIKRFIRNYLRGMGLAGTVDISVLATELRHAVSDVAIIGVRGNSGRAFNSVFMTRGLSNGAMSEKEKFIATSITLSDYEYAASGAITLNFN